MPALYGRPTTSASTRLGPLLQGWTFDVEGSVSGPDGSGGSSAVFIPKTGRTRIEPDDWLAPGKVRAGYEVRWQVRAMFVDQYRAADGGDLSREPATTLAQGLSNSKHRLP